MIRGIFCICMFWLASFASSHAAIVYTKPDERAVSGALDDCQRNNNISSQPEKYTCLTGEFGSQNGKEFSHQVKQCAMKMSLTFSAIDEAAKKWVGELQKQRNPDAEVWMADIQSTINDPDGLYDTYLSVCRITNWTFGDTPTEVACVKTTDFFPETTCEKLARQKAEAWKNTGYILMAKGIAKNTQNQKDVFVDQKKTKYSELVNKWNSYKRIVANAVAKFTAYTRTPVQ